MIDSAVDDSCSAASTPERWPRGSRVAIESMRSEVTFLWRSGIHAPWRAVPEWTQQPAPDRNRTIHSNLNAAFGIMSKFHCPMKTADAVAAADRCCGSDFASLPRAARSRRDLWTRSAVGDPQTCPLPPRSRIRSSAKASRTRRPVAFARVDHASIEIQDQS